MKLSFVIDELVEERGLDRSILNSIICEGMLAAYSKKYPDLTLDVVYDKKTDEIQVMIKKTVVANVQDEEVELSLRKARFIDPNAELDQELWVPFEGKIGRIEILRAKQVIASKIRQIEASAVYKEFKEKEGTIVLGVIHKCERNGASVMLGETLAFLPKSLSIPDQKCTAGFTIRALLKEVLPEPRNDNQLILDRASADFLKKLFELEIPELFEGLIEIKKIVRIPGYKAKIAVSSNDPNIDPVGTCVGMGGARIKPILKELGTEKIDVITWSDSLTSLVRDALKPAEINRVELAAEEGNVLVWLDEDQRSLAIGKMGQNISLASQLTGVAIHLMTNEKPNLEDDVTNVSVDADVEQESM